MCKSWVKILTQDATKSTLFKLGPPLFKDRVQAYIGTQAEIHMGPLNDASIMIMKNNMV